MSIPAERLGYKGQRYIITFREDKDSPVRRTLGWTDREDGGGYVEAIDRHHRWCDAQVFHCNIVGDPIGDPVWPRRPH